MHKTIIALLGISLPTGAIAQDAAPAVLVPNTEVTMTLNDEVSSKTMRVGQTFAGSVSRDVMVGNTIVIPRGAKGVGEVTWRTGKGAFGKSAKMEIALRRVEVGGRWIPITGTYRQEGRGNTGATIGTIVVAGVIAGAFVTGRSAVFERGRELRAHTVEALALDGTRISTTPAVAVAAVTVAPAVLPVTTPAQAPVVAVAVATPVQTPAPVMATAPMRAPVPAPAVRLVPANVPVMAPSAVVAPAPATAYASPVARHWPDRQLHDQPTMGERLKVMSPVARVGRGWTISD